MTDTGEWDLTTDVVVVGSGGGGLCAALAARSHGLDVLVAEKAEVVGGSTAMSGGGMWIPDNPLMRAAGAPDSADRALTYFEAVVGDVGPASSPERRRSYVENGPRLVSFLQDLGVPFRFADGYADYYSGAPGGSERGRTIEAHPYDTRALGDWAPRLRPGMSTGLGLIGFGTELSAMTYYNRHPRNLAVAARVWLRTRLAKLRGRRMVANGAALVGRLLELALAQDVQVRTQAPLRELVVADGAVVGVVLGGEDGGSTRVRARGGVLLAAGGFSRNAELRATYGGSQARSAQWSIANPGDTGEVLLQAMAAGAATDLMDEAIWLPMACLPDGRLPAYPSRQTSAFGRARWRPGSIIVDAAGRRFANEAVSTSELAQRMFAHDAESRSVPAWLVFDDAFRRRCLFGAVPGRLPQKWLDDGFVQRAGSLAELARLCGIDPDGLAETCRRFNGFARDGVDADFSRGESAYDRFMGDPRHGPNNCLAPVERGPFYAVAVYPCDVGTCGGVLTDADARVLTADGVPIPGLFATGNTTASVQGRAYLGAGGSIGPTCTFGYVAANTIAAQRAETTSAAS
ncbi:FAD-binding protein [Trujillonella endophytica]|uniref:3-oxosteroid 1-dehydrogenase n=1 Tax=Trujillonella endophytica TaxID=673521 RepID=A0A1H8WGC0_9ACTN|nr:FAD-binding protein [Trujillella endophytica]SEP26702.1 3-oxosteroid 1-dehydrogenase [Trujillella endophytica]